MKAHVPYPGVTGRQHGKSVFQDMVLSAKLKLNPNLSVLRVFRDEARKEFYIAGVLVASIPV